MTEKYQDFGDGGHNASDEKLSRLSFPDDMKGMRFLDLGCNAGYFCLEAIRRGAEATGIEEREDYRRDASNNVAKAGHSEMCEIVEGSWREVVPEFVEMGRKYNVILWSSAIHYEKDQRWMMEHLVKLLTPEGVLILECGVLDDAGRGPIIKLVSRVDGSAVPHFSFDYVQDHLLKGIFVSRVIGRSVNQDGDRVPRWVIHCHPKKKNLIIVRGNSGAGKTNYAVNTAVSTDSVLIRVDDFFWDMEWQRKMKTPIGKFLALRKCFDRVNDQEGPFRIDQTMDQMITEGLAPDLAKLIHRIMSDDFDYVLEGYLPDEVLAELKKLVGDRIIWETERAV